MDATFRRYARSLTTGQDYAEASRWFAELVAQKEECLRLCCGVMAGADAVDATSEAVFMAANVVHTSFFRTGHFAAHALDPEAVHAMVWALFSSERLRAQCQTGLAGGAAHRQLSLCIAASLATAVLQHTAEAAQLAAQLVQSLSNFATQSADHLDKVLRIVEELPVEIHVLRPKMRVAPDSANDGNGGDEGFFALLYGLRDSVLLDQMKTHAERAFERAAAVVSALGSGASVGGSGGIGTLLPELHADVATLLRCVKCLQAWCSSEFASSSGSRSRGLLPFAHLVTMASSTCRLSYGGGTSYFDACVRLLRGALALAAALAPAVAGDLDTLRTGTRLVSDLVAVATGLCGVFTELLAYPSPPTCDDEYEATAHAAASFTLFFVVAYAWDTLLRGPAGGLLQWRADVDAAFAAASGAAMSAGGGAASPLARVEAQCHRLWTSGDAAADATLVTALVDLTAAVAEKHVAPLFSPCPVYATVRAVQGPGVAQAFGVPADLFAPERLGHLLTSVLAAALAQADRRAAAGAAEVVTYVCKSVPSALLFPVVEPWVTTTLAVLFAQYLHPHPPGAAHGAPDNTDTSTEGPWYWQHVFIATEEARGEGRGGYLRDVAGDVDEAVHGVLEYRREGGAVLQAVYTGWPGGAAAWGAVARLALAEACRAAEGSGASRSPPMDTCARHLEALLHMMASLVECVHDASSTAHGAGGAGARFLTGSQYLAQQSAADAHAGAGTGAGAGPAAWFLDVARLSAVLLASEPLQDGWVWRYPGVALRLLQLWAAAAGSFTAACVPASAGGDVVASLGTALRLCCAAARADAPPVLLAPAFHALHATTQRFRAHLPPHVSLALTEWLLHALGTPTVDAYLHSSGTDAAKVFATLGRVVVMTPEEAVNPNTAAANAGGAGASGGAAGPPRSRSSLVAMTLTALTSALDVSALDAQLTALRAAGAGAGAGGGPTDAVTSGLLAAVRPALHRCLRNLSCLKGFLRGLVERVSCGDDDEEEEEEDEEDKGEGGGAAPASAGVAASSSSLMYAQFVPPLCAGLFSMLQLLAQYDVAVEALLVTQQRHARRQQRHQHQQQEEETEPCLLDLEALQEASDGDANELTLLAAVTERLSATLCDIVDAPAPHRCPLPTLLQGAHGVAAWLRDLPWTLCHAVPPVLAFATALVRQGSDHYPRDAATRAALPPLPALALARAAFLTARPDFVATGCYADAVVEALRTFRQACLACPAALAGPGGGGVGEALFQTCGQLLQHRSALQHGALLRMVNTACGALVRPTDRRRGGSSGSGGNTTTPAGAVPTPLDAAGCRPAFAACAGDLLVAFLSTGLYGEEDRAQRTLAGCFETLVTVAAQNNVWGGGGGGTHEAAFAAAVGSACRRAGEQLAAAGAPTAVFVTPHGASVAVGPLAWMEVAYATVAARYHALLLATHTAGGGGGADASTAVRAAFLELCQVLRAGKATAAAVAGDNAHAAEMALKGAVVVPTGLKLVVWVG